MDKLLLDCLDGCGFLSSLLQLCVLQLVVFAFTENRTTIIQLRGYFNEFAGVTCNAKATNQGDTAEGLQGSGKWKVSRWFFFCH